MVEFSPEERLDLVRWHLDRYDRLRGSVAGRAAMVLSANALLLAGATFLLRTLPVPAEGVVRTLKVCVASATLPILVLVAVSVAFGLNAVVSPKKTSRQLFGAAIPNRFVFIHRDTVETCKDYRSFAEEFLAQSTEETLESAQATLWTVIKQHHLRYKNLRRAVRTLALSVPLFLLAVGLFVATVMLEAA